MNFKKWMESQGYYKDEENCWCENNKLVPGKELYKKLQEFKNL